VDVADEPESVVDAVVARWADARGRIVRFGEWRRRLAQELSELPDTMQQLRHGAANFELVGERLAKSSASLEEIADLYQSTIAEPGHRSAQALDALRTQVDALANAAGSPEQIAATMTDVQRAFDTIADLNPFWPRSNEKR
jgi:uncharacterized protein YukE